MERIIWALWRKTPFEPFRIKLINGDGHDVAYAGLLSLLDETVFVAAQDGTWAEFPYRSVASVESLIDFP